MGSSSGVRGFNEPSEQDLMQRASPGIPMHWNAVYYANWRANNIPPPSALNLGYISHIFYAFACNEWVDEHQPVDGTEGYLRALVQRKRDSQVKVLLSIGGGGIGSKNFAAVAGKPAAVERFLSSAAELANKFNLDGATTTTPSSTACAKNSQAQPTSSPPPSQPANGSSAKLTSSKPTSTSTSSTS
ncbi:hypothetical protein EMPG_15623 [Blastomyces silverae]|uniref:GH18 domain-containing protein n=1 Tax=Blastomyces silverae TaxID=2060906 RepID=A0A0H1BC61_9EURO|nr:hypothetical protein EMPG_15623 [Blastomyces silverae]